MTTFSTGRAAEQAAADYLTSLGYTILVQNWRTRFCEIDLVVQKADTVYFVEVKYRQSGAWGSGLEYITAAKLRQMHFAAEMWVNEYRWDGSYNLSAIEVSGNDFKVTEFIDSIV